MILDIEILGYNFIICYLVISSLRHLRSCELSRSVHLRVIYIFYHEPTRLKFFHIQIPALIEYSHNVKLFRSFIFMPFQWLLFFFCYLQLASFHFCLHFLLLFKQEINVFISHVSNVIARSKVFQERSKSRQQVIIFMSLKSFNNQCVLWLFLRSIRSVLRKKKKLKSIAIYSNHIDYLHRLRQRFWDVLPTLKDPLRIQSAHACSLCDRAISQCICWFQASLRWF